MSQQVYNPKSVELKEVRERISEASWSARVADARRREKTVEKIVKRIADGKSQNAAIKASVQRSKRSATLRDLANYDREGFEGLVDRRTPRESAIPIGVRDAVEVARMANPSITVEEVEEILERKYKSQLSPATMKRIWNEAGLERREGRPKTRANDALEESEAEQETDVEVEPLEAAGFQIVRAAEAETKAVERLVDTVMEVGEGLPAPGPVPAREQKLRNKDGQLTARYNRARRKARGEQIGPAYQTAKEKAEKRDLGRLSFGGQQRETIERKVWALVSLPAVTPLNGRIEDLRGPQGNLLGEMCGFPYQAETIRKVVSEFTVAGLGPLLQQSHASTWHKVSIERWETDYQAAVVYVDNNVKPLWTSLFTKSTKVSSTGRVQPALTSTFVNTGVGVPIHFETYSGPAPLAPRVLQLLEHVEEQNEQEVGRLTVIDGECCSASLLAQFKAAQRDLLVPLRARMCTPERIRFGSGSAFRAYRNGDLIREGEIVLRDSKNRDTEVEARAIVIQRRTKEDWTVLATLADKEVWSARGLANAYFGRWPNQEGFFRRANQALGLQRVHGYGKRMVANVAVLTKLERLGGLIQQAQSKQDDETEELESTEQTLDETNKVLGRVTCYRAKREQRVDEGMEEERRHTKQFKDALQELRESSEEERGLQKKQTSLGRRQAKLASRLEKRQGQLKKWERERKKLESQTEIIEADTAQDTLFTSLKLTLGMLVHFAMVEYFPDPLLEWSTFLSRVAPLPGRRETTCDTVTVFIYGNRRDLKLMKAINAACHRINERNLIHDDKRLRYELEWVDGVPDGWCD